MCHLASLHLLHLIASQLSFLLCCKWSLCACVACDLQPHISVSLVVIFNWFLCRFLQPQPISQSCVTESSNSFIQRFVRSFNFVRSYHYISAIWYNFCCCCCRLIWLLFVLSWFLLFNVYSHMLHVGYFRLPHPSCTN